jgi:hypothetical protein
LAVAFGLGCLTLAGCPGDLDPHLLGGGGGGSGGTGGSPVCDGIAVMKNQCAAATCHGVNAPASGLDLFSDGVVMRLLGKLPSPTASMSCPTSTMPYLMAGSNPATGLLLDKLKAMPSCGLAMPYPLGGLGGGDVTCLQEWSTAVTTGVITQ